MHKRWIVAPLFALALISPSLTAQTCPITRADKTAVADTVRNFYAAATVDDLSKIHAFTAPTFYIYDNGQSFDSIDSLIDALKAYQAKGVKFVWKVTNPRVTIHCNEAWITYLNDGSVQMPNAAPIPTKWLESVILEKQHGAWKMLFFHSTLVPPPEPPK
ncbi:MAG: DUF4440 domain-containing protein [Acidobacteriaceae bacterium]